MKTSIVLVLGLSLASAPISHAQGARPAVAVPSVSVSATMTAAQILEKSRQTYAAFSVYKGSCSVVGDVVLAIGDGDGEPTQNVSSASAQIEFVRGKYLTVEGVDSGGDSYKAQWTPGKASIDGVRKGPEAGPQEAGKSFRSDYKDETITADESMVAGLTGMTGGTGSILPAVLRNDIFWSNPFPSKGDQLELLAPRNLGTTPCYVIVATNVELNSVNTFWVEQKTFLLRRLTEEQGEQRFDDMPKRNGVEEPVIRMAYSTNQYVFATTEAE